MTDHTDDLVERLKWRAATFNTGVYVDPECVGTLGYYSAGSAALDLEAIDRIEAQAAEITALRTKLTEAMEHDQWGIISRAIERYSAGEISDLHAIGLVASGFLKLEETRDAALRALQSREGEGQ